MDYWRLGRSNATYNVTAQSAEFNNKRENLYRVDLLYSFGVRALIL